jgi:hypothetical protein
VASLSEPAANGADEKAGRPHVGRSSPGKTDISGRRSPDRQPLMGTREAEGIYFTSARRTARRPMASGIQSHTIVVTASCCQYSVVIELSKSRVVA